MNTLRKIFILTGILTFILYIGTKLSFNLVADKEINLLSFFLTGIVISTLYPAGLSVLLKPRFKYLESKEPDEPMFRDKRERSIALKNETIEFNEIKNEIQKYWIVTYFNENEKIIKYRMKIGIGTWGAGVFLKFDIESNQLKIVSFPIEGYTKKGNKLAMKMIEMTENIIYNK